jgi:tetratricopeptide (TPR) repeat protein
MLRQETQKMIHKKNSPALLLQKIGLIFFGLVLTLVIVESGLRLSGWLFGSIQELRNRDAIQKKGTYRIMCLGESTTAMQYPPYLEEILNEKSAEVKFSVIDKGVSGTITDTILLRLEDNLDDYHPDMVITMMGINDNPVHMPRETLSNSPVANFLKSFRIYKLFRWLELHLSAKIRDLGWAKLPFPQGDEKEKREQREPVSKYKALVKQGNIFREQRKYEDAEAAYKQAIALEPQKDEAYYELGDTYRELTRYPEAEKACQKAIEINPENYDAYRELGDAYRYQGETAKAEASYQTAIKLNPSDFRAYPKLGTLYQEHKRYAEALELFEGFIKNNSGHPHLDRAYGALEGVYRDMGDPARTETYRDKTKQMRMKYRNPDTEDNYRRLRTLLRERGISYVCAQYPMRDVDSLKKIFAEDPEGIIFVDNEKLFKEAVRRDGAATYFRDMIGGDFGHCTEKGNRLLAENIADTILQKIFRERSGGSGL